MTHLLDMMILQKLIKFGLVGSLGMGIDFLITWFCKEKLLLNKYLANAAGFTVAVFNNFLLNYLWTFGSTGNIPTELGIFFLIAVIGLVLNSSILYLFNDRIHFNFYVSKAIAIVCVFFWNFALNYLFNFHS